MLGPLLVGEFEHPTAAGPAGLEKVEVVVPNKETPAKGLLGLLPQWNTTIQSKCGRMWQVRCRLMTLPALICTWL